jgi:hypothetical protein
MDCGIMDQVGNGLKVALLGLAAGGIMWLLVPEKRRAEAERARRKETEASARLRRMREG